MCSFRPGHAWHVRAPGASFGNLAVRYALEAGGPTSGNSLDRKSWTVAETPGPDPVDGDWRQVVDRLQAERDAAPDQPELWATAVYGGEGLQWFHGHGRGVSNPDRVVGGQDMGSVRASANGGRFWYAPVNDGLQIIGVEAVLVDPVDADVVYALATTYFDKDFAHDGVYRSTDFCRTWTLVHNIPRLQPFNRYAKKTIARWPVETGAAGAASIRVATMMGGYDEPDEASQLWNGAGGGTSWTSKGTLSRATYGRLAQLCQHPTTENMLYLCSETGLHVTTNWNAATPDWSRPWARFGASVAVSRIWIDPDDVNRIIVGCTGADADQGIWFSADGGATWTRALDIDAGNFAMGCRDPASANRRRIYVHNKAATRPKVSTYAAAGGSPFGAWTEPSVVPSAPGVTELDYTSLSYERPRQPMGSFHEFLPHPTDPDECLNYAYHHYFRTVDGGASFRDSNSGYCGANHRDLVFDPDPANWGVLYGATADVTHARLFDVARVSASFRVPESIAVAGDTLRSGRAITVLPRVAPVPAAARGRVIVTAGNASNLGIYHKPEDGKAVGWQGFGEIDPAYGGQGVQRARLDYDRQAPNWVYCGRNRSDDGGTTWGDLAGGYDFAAVSRQDGAKIYGYDRGTGRIGVSGDRGASWAPYYTTNVDLAAGRPEVWLDPTDDTRVYTVEQTGGRRDFCLLKGASAPAKVSMGLFAAMQAGAGRTPAAYGPTELAVDPFDPRRVYAQLRTHGNPWMWRGRWDAGFTAIEWEDVTRNLPRATQNTCLAISPWTGDIFCGTPNGLYVLAPPDGYKAAYGLRNSIYDAMPKPWPNGWRSLQGRPAAQP